MELLRANGIWLDYHRSNCKTNTLRTYQTVQNTCDTPMVRRVFRARSITHWNIIDKETVDEIILWTNRVHWFSIGLPNPEKIVKFRNEYIFEAYVNYQHDMILFTGFPIFH